MKTLDLTFTIQGKEATVVIEFSDNDAQPIAAIRLSYGDFVAVGQSNVRECLGESYDPLIAHVLRERQSVEK